MTKPKRHLKVVALLLGLAAAASNLAQSTTANLAGQAKPGDVAVVVNSETGFTREVKVKDNGRYQLRNLPTGTYSITIKHADGSLEASRMVTLRLGGTTRVQ